MGLTLASIALLVESLRVWTVLVAILSLYRIINLLRLSKSRIQPDYLYHVTRRTTLWLIGLQVADLGLAGASNHYGIRSLTYFYLLSAVQLIAAMIVLASTSRHLRTSQPPTVAGALADRDLPSLTVAIPARNETADLQACLESLVASSYPKLEILVLDDCSQNKQTSEIIRGFAHAGVRFVAGKTPPGQWLAKNYAYEQLRQEANGELLLFCGVDTRFEKDSLGNIVKVLLQKHKSMVSILPRNLPPQGWSVAGTLIQPSRYAWELALPRRFLRRPPVLSTCWLISRRALDKAGGFAAVSRKAVPESYLARQAAAAEDGYSFLQSNSRIAISSLKSLDEQKATAVRTRYPQLHRRPEMVALVSLAEFTILACPPIACILSLLHQDWLLAAITGLAYLLEATAYGKIVNLTYRKILLRGSWLLPIAAVYDIGLLNYSMWRYEFREVLWKGRNVCIPVMRVTATLPKLP